MSHNTLVFLCYDIPTALKAAIKLPKSNLLKRFFIFLGDRPSSNELDWIVEPDSFLVLENAKDWSDSDMLLAVRCGFLYTTGYNSLFCLASNPPSEKQVTAALDLCNGPNMAARLETVWGYSREFIAYYGFPILENELESQSEEQIAPSSTIDPIIEIKRALKGKPVGCQGFIDALSESAPLRSFKLRTGEKSRAIETISEALVSSFGQRFDDRGESYLALGSLTPKDIESMRTEISRHGCVVLIADTKNESFYASLKPYRIIRCIDGCSALLFSYKQDSANATH